MPHIHELIDFTVGAFIVENDRVLLIDHKKLGIWLCPGGHIELHEDPEEAILREVKEETGLEITLVGERCHYKDANCKSLVRPRWMDIHGITATHKHVGLFYLARPKSGRITLAPEEHNGIGWFDEFQIQDLKIAPSTIYYAKKAIRELHNDVQKVRR